MLDHVFTDAIGAVRDALEAARLERQALEERFHADILLGDVVWETTYALPGEGSPPRAQVDLTLEWPTWAQTAYRNWYLDQTMSEWPKIAIDIIFRLQRLSATTDPAIVMSALPEGGPTVGDVFLEGTGPTLETVYEPDLTVSSHAVEVCYHGSFELDESTLADGSALDADFARIGGWIATALVRLGDLSLDFLPPDESESLS